jgi:hypothetical protein
MGKFEEALEKYAKYVIQQARTNLTKDKKGKGKLYNSLSYKIEKGKVSFLAENYGVFVDQGVKGKNPSKVSPNAKITGQQAPNSEYKFGSRKFSGTFKKFVAEMSKWAQKKNIRFRDAKGKFAKGNYQSLGYVIASNIYNRGLRPTMFFTKPFEKAFPKFEDEIMEGFLDDNLKLE